VPALTNIHNRYNLGYHCAHAYPHTEKETINTLPATLKGVDKVVYECFFATQFNVILRHMLDLPTDYDFGYGETPIECLLGINQEYNPGEPPQHLANMFEWVENDYAKYKCNKWRIKTESRRRGDLAVLADRLEPLRLTDAGLEENMSYREIVEEWTSNYNVNCVKWLNEPSQHQPALLHGAVSTRVSEYAKLSPLTI